MLQIGKRFIKNSIEEIVTSFRSFASERGISVFSVIKPEGENLLVTCPNREHKNMQERTPSCRIAVSDISASVKAGTVHCFSCGYKAFLDSTFSQILGREDGGEFGREWILNNFDSELNNTRGLDIELESRSPKKEEPFHYLTDEDLDRFRYNHPYWQKRKIDEATMIRFDLGYDKETRSITMPVWDNQGRCIGVTLRSVDRKAFTLTEGLTKPVYLLNYAIKEHWSNIYLCESQINALYMNSLGYNSCAIFGTGSPEQADQINRSGVRSVVFCFDGDFAGRKGRERIRKMLSPRIFCTYIDLPDGKDVNDLSPEEIKALIQAQKIF